MLSLFRLTGRKVLSPSLKFQKAKIPKCSFTSFRYGGSRNSVLSRHLSANNIIRTEPCKTLKFSSNLAGATSGPVPKPADAEEGITENNSNASDVSAKFYPNDSPFQNLDCEVAFKNLDLQEKLYAHYISRASWDGQFINFFQTSPESPLIFIFLDKVLRFKPTVNEMKEFLKNELQFTDAEITALLVYAGAFMANGGNYRGFGDSKFLPNVPSDKLNALAQKVFKSDEIDFFKTHCMLPMVDYQPAVRSLGFPPHGITTYWSANCDDDDAKIVTEYLSKKKMDAYNQRVFKTSANTNGQDVDFYEIRFASKQLTNETDTTSENLIGKIEEFKGKKFQFTRGDYSDIMPHVIENLKKAQSNALNENEKSMMAEYVKYFDTGSLQSHKEGSRFWIKDKGPAVETYIGFIENYRDPAGARAEFEGFAAVVNKEASKKLGELVIHAEQIIKKSMPWPKEYEKDNYLRPDFTALDIITFSGSGVPAGINIPNYDDIRQNEGFKNVHLQNVIMAQNKAAKVDFVSPTDRDYVVNHREEAFEVQVGLHELLGHGSGKIFKKESDGSMNFPENLTDPLTTLPVKSWYKSGESYDSVFTTLSSTYEECRAECIGIYLSTLPEVLKVFHLDGERAEDTMYVNWLAMVLSGVRGLEAYNKDISKWGQAHSQARFVILRVLLEEAKGLVEIKETVNAEDGKPDMLITMDRSKIRDVGREAIGKFLLKLQVYKSTANIEEARKMYNGYSEVSHTSPTGHDFLKLREIILDRKKPRPILVQSNTRINGDDVELITYESTPEGFTQSWIDRYRQTDELYSALTKLYKKDLAFFPLNSQ